MTDVVHSDVMVYLCVVLDGCVNCPFQSDIFPFSSFYSYSLKMPITTTNLPPCSKCKKVTAVTYNTGSTNKDIKCAGFVTLSESLSPLAQISASRVFLISSYFFLCS